MPTPLLDDPNKVYESTILIVDDDSAFRENLEQVIRQFCPENLHITFLHATFAEEAVKILAQHPDVELILLDVNLPDHHGFWILDMYKKQGLAFTAQIILMSAYDLSSYYALFEAFNVYHFITKVLPFDYHRFGISVIQALFPGSYKGIKPYFDPGTTILKNQIVRSEEIAEVANQVVEYSIQKQLPSPEKLMIALVEALTNAVYHAKLNDKGESRYAKGANIPVLKKDELVHIEYAADEQKLAILIRDQGGNIQPESIIYYFRRNSSAQTSTQDAEGGRGLYLIHQLMDVMIVNISPGNQTEMIMMMYFDQEPRQIKPFVLNLAGEAV